MNYIIFIYNFFLLHVANYVILVDVRRGKKRKRFPSIKYAKQSTKIKPWKVSKVRQLSSYDLPTCIFINKHMDHYKWGVNFILCLCFARLQERFVTPLSSGGPCPSPSFSNVQEFFKGFIQSAARYTIYKHDITDVLTLAPQAGHPRF